MTMLVYMVGRNIPLYGIDIDAYSNVNVDAQSILLQAISGDMKNCSIFIIGLWPYMLASMLAILIVAIISLDHTRKLSPKKINIWTVTIMMIIAAVQAYHKTQTLMYRVSGYELIWNKIIVFIQLIAGMLIVVYMCDRATRYGIGGKVSVFMVNIVSGMMTMFTGKPLEKLTLPVAIGVAEIAVMIVLETTEKRIAVFFDRYDAQAQSIIVRDKKAFFKPSIRTYSYRIELINGGNADFTFKSLVIKEVSEEEFDAEQERIERLKEDSNKSKKKRRKNKKSK